ncbi:ATP-dependent zinc metalloprotease FtsH [Microbulbifer sp. OS29]|uniref:ATP-dependent zinc metalloprotease FtsH n=1 Tax=Microbulbifer okhotskensis TaxID=2926617 RepID=A0A9X2ENN9_9GAMM|nr:ATP-dependent zinc metalloprotease FtsH [Microbulbifer okhotskensis]MCO1335036.1 ATP-dependent zinc metalloprotease FtsH [Microbulbifer okhotskensis]
MADEQDQEQKLPQEEPLSPLPGKPLQKGPLSWLQYFLWVSLLVVTVQYCTNGQLPGKPTELAYSSFKQEVAAGKVASVVIEGDRVTGTFRAELGQLGEGKATANKESKKTPPERFTTILPSVQDPELLPLLEKQKVEILAESPGGGFLQRMLILLLPWILIIGLLVWMGRRMQEKMASGAAGSPFGFARSPAKRFERSESQVTFDDVAGLANAKKDLQEVAGYLKNPGHYRKLGAKIPRGILLMGPPGTGKTLMAKALAGESEAPFFSISGSEFIEMFVGVGASRVRDMFSEAKKDAPSIIFIDEIDSVGRARGAGVGGGHDEREQTLNQILGEMDGFDPQEAVVVVAATNRPDVLDAALMRPGRFDRKITLDLPDKAARREILEIHSRDVPLHGKVDLQRLAALTAGFAGADLENLINEAALLAGREDRSAVDMDCLLRARDKVVLGSEREMVIGEEDREIIAYHEAGHALVATLLPHADPLEKATIIPRGQSLGATEQIPIEEHHSMQVSYLRDRIGVMLGGRVAERVVFKEVSTGAEADLKQATGLARHMVTHWGMSEKLGPVAFRRGEEHIFLGREMAQQKDFSEHTSEIIDDEIIALISGIEKKVEKLLTKNRKKLDVLARALLEKETLEALQINEILLHADTRGDDATAIED